MSNNNCISYLEVLVPRFKGEMDQAISNGERPSARSKEMWMECTKRKNTIMAACGQGAMTVEDYKAACESQLVKDKAMLKYFM